MQLKKIGLEWNCSKKDINTQELIDGKYYFFIKKGENNTICNIFLVDSIEKHTNISYDIEDGKWTKY